jgi:hypothetical protein
MSTSKNLMITVTVLTATITATYGQLPILTQQQVKNIDDVREVIKQKARHDIETTTRRTIRRPLHVTSRDRPAGPLKSAAHDRGAIDISSKALSHKRRHREALEISRSLGRNNTVVVEEKIQANGRTYDQHTSYNNGRLIRRVTKPSRATATHTHIQPNYGLTPRARNWHSAHDAGVLHLSQRLRAPRTATRSVSSVNPSRATGVHRQPLAPRGWPMPSAYPIYGGWPVYSVPTALPPMGITSSAGGGFGGGINR